MPVVVEAPGDDAQDAQGEDAQQGGDEVLHPAGEHAAHIGVDDGSGELAHAGGQEEGPEADGGQPGEVAHCVKGHEGQQAADQDGVPAIFLEVALHAGQGALAGVLLHRVPAQGPGDKEAQGRPAMALDQERMAPCHQPKMAALAKVMRKAGRGAITEENTISRRRSPRRRSRRSG